MPTCTEGHASAADDYCDVCGSPIGSSAAQPVSPPARGAGLPGMRDADQRPLL